MVTAQVDRDSITVGDRLVLTLRITEAAVDSSAFFAFPDGRIGSFEILEAGEVAERLEEGVRVREAAYRITAWETGSFEIPSLAAETGGEPSRAIPITVRSVGLDPSGEIREIRGPVAISTSLLRNLAPILVLLLLVAVAAYLYRRWRRRGIEPAPVLGTVDLRPAHIAAFEELDRLEGNFRREGRADRSFYFRLSAIVRQYLRGRYALPAPERTSREILREVRREKLNPDSTALLRAVLGRCDLVKYRGTEPPREEAESAMGDARHFVESTREQGVRGGGDGE